MISGARQAEPNWFHRVVARAMARQLNAFVVPGPDVAGSLGLSVAAAGLRIVDTPRHAAVLLLVGELPEGLREAAAVAYAQMMRPRAILAAGTSEASPLPEPDVTTALDQEALEAGVEGLRRAFARGAFAPEVETFEPEVVQESGDGEEEMHHDHGHMNHDHGHMHHDPGEAEEEPGEDDEAREEVSGEKEIGEDQLENFMSMMEMTEGMPASGDGLIMEWVPAPYGPLFPGLPGGLSLNFTLDGDTVAETEVEPGIRGHSPAALLRGPAGTLAERAAKLDPLSPVAYQMLARRAIDSVAGSEIGDEEARSRIGALERERAASHLGWVANFGILIGYGSLSRRAASLQLALLRAEDLGEIGRVAGAGEKFVRQALRTPLLESKLGGIGVWDVTPEGGVENGAGPVARAAGFGADARHEEPAYRKLGFSPTVRTGNDALTRFRLRLEEILQSLNLVLEAGSVTPTGSLSGGRISGAGAATVETPRGTAFLEVTLEAGTVTGVELHTPSMRNVRLVEAVTVGREVADALVGAGSLDLSPWEMSG
ncbi:MAG: hypothetical protein ACFB50_00540 [Rubrobacteraceae bacterium]